MYLGLVVLLNFLVDYLLLLGTTRLTGYPCRYGRITVGAALGVVQAAACLIPGFSFLGNFLWRWVFPALMGLISFGMDRSMVRPTAVFLLLRMALSGIAMGTGDDRIGTVALCGGAVWLLCRFGFGCTGCSREYIPVELISGDRRVRAVALRDTGNLLTDPVTGERVLVAGSELAGTLLGLTEQQLRDPVQTLASGAGEGLRLIPYRSVGCSGGLLLAGRFRRVKIGKTVADPLIAFAPEEIGRGEGYQMLAGGVI